MRIELNGKPHDAGEHSTIAELLQQLGLGERRVAVEVNRAIVPRSQHASHRLAENDAVELVHAMGGG